MIAAASARPHLDLRSVAERLEAVRGRVTRVCERSGRAPDEVTIVGITKTHPVAVTRLARDAGLAHLGENRADELAEKADALPEVEWHFVGRLQSNKSGDVVGRAQLIHSVDRRSLVDALDRRARRAGIVQRVLVQVNVAGDPAKGGCSPETSEQLIAYACARDNVAVEGLMTIPPMPPASADPAAHVQPVFASLRQLRDDVRERYPEVRQLSMGMSADFEAAVAEGATIVRLGTVLFGPRR